MPKETQQLLDERGKSYGNAHYLTGLVLGVLKKPLGEMLANAPELSHDWIQVLSKLIRILHDPYKIDSWDDLIGYAMLCKRIIAGEGENDG
jgi:hypothetical protein